MNFLKSALILGLGLLPLVYSLNLAAEANPNPIPTITYDMVGIDNQSVGKLEAPDFSSLTFRNLGSFSEAGSIPDDYNHYAGYALSRQWQAGDSVAEVLKLGDIDDSFGVGQFTLGEIVNKSGRQLTHATLAQFGFIEHQTVANFLQANPQLKDRPIKNITPLADLVTLKYGYEGRTLLELPAQILISDNKQPVFKELSWNKSGKNTNNKSTILLKLDISEIEMGELDLSQYTLENVAGIEDSYLKNYEDWQNEQLSSIEGLADISFNNFPNPISTSLSFISRVDFIWGEAHGEVKSGQSISGSNRAGYHVPCDRACAHLELDDLENSGRDIRLTSEGGRWMLGNDPNNGAFCPDAPWGVKGGQGLLGILNCGREPTGRNPFGSAFKVALWSVDETKDTAETAIFFRFCKRGIPDLGCTPYFIGPIPFLTVSREDWIIIGSGSKQRNVIKRSES